MQGECTDELLSSHPSPDGAWRADDVRTHCEAGFGGDPIVVGVQLSRPDGDAAPTDILGLDYGNAADLKVDWTAPDRLRVTVPNGGYLKVLTRRVGPVDVDVELDPPDPAASQQSR